MSSELATPGRAATRPGRAAKGDEPGIRWSWILSTLAVWTLGVAFAAFFWGYLNHGVHGLDSRAYWLAARHTHPYGAKPGSPDAYLYSPAFSTLIWPLAQLPMHVFVGVWMVVESAVFVWLLKPLGLRWGVPAFGLCMAEVVVGNIYSFLAVVAVIGLRYPAAWALPLLTKLTPGLGPVWFAVRREWRSVAISLGATALIALLSFAITPHQWFDWIHFLAGHHGESQALLPLRFALAVGVIAFASWRRKPMLVPVALLLANPMVWHSYMAWTLLAAIPRLAVGSRQNQPSDTPGAAE